MPRPWTFTGDYWKHKELFVALDLTMGSFHLLLMLLGVIGSRFRHAGLRELTVQSDIVAEGSDGVQYKNVLPTYTVKSWNKLPSVCTEALVCQLYR